MRIVYLCKRHYMGKDVIADRYGRLYEQPYQLALRGHEVLGICGSYRKVEGRDENHIANSGSMRWIGLEVGSLGSLELPLQYRRMSNLIRDFDPQIIVGASDCPFIIMAFRLARKMNIPFAADLYDHFEAFGLSRIPGVVPLYREALRQAAVVSCVSQPLAELVREQYRAPGEVVALPSTIDRSLFYPRDQKACRSQFKLPVNARLIGSAGGLSADKGILPLYQAFEGLSKQDPDLHLVLAGQIDPTCPPPTGDRVHYLGKLSHSQVAELFCALDVAVVYLRDTPYGRFSFPQKAFEVSACGVSMAIARVGAMEAVFKKSGAALYEPDNAESLAASVKDLLSQPRKVEMKIMDWADQATVLEQYYMDAI